MDKIRKYTPEDYETLCSWFKAREKPCIGPSQLPQNGFIADGVAAGFVYLTDSNFCILDVYISNPKAEPRKRDTALNLITMHLLAFAKSSGFESVICSTQSSSVGLRARKFGFQEVSKETCYARSI